MNNCEIFKQRVADVETPEDMAELLYEIVENLSCINDTDPCQYIGGKRPSKDLCIKCFIKRLTIEHNQPH